MSCGFVWLGVGTFGLHLKVSKDWYNGVSERDWDGGEANVNRQI